MAFQHTREGCEALINEVVRCIRVARGLSEGVLIDCNSITLDGRNTISFKVHENGFDPEEDLCFQGSGVFQNNMAFIVGQLQKLNGDVFQYMCLMKQAGHYQSTKMFNRDDVRELMNICRDITPDGIPALIGMVEGVRIVDGKGY